MRLCLVDYGTLMHPLQLGLQVLICYLTFPQDDRLELVYVGQTMRLQASVGVGVDLTFRWTFSDMAEEIVDIPESHSPKGCAGQECLQSTQVAI